MRYAAAFVAGFLSTLVFHQGMLTLFWLSGLFPRAPYQMQATGPLGVPAVVSLAFWGGAWGAALWPALKAAEGAAYWRRAVALGAVLPSAVALLIVYPLKGMPVAGGFDPRLIAAVLILNGTWGFGLALFARLMAPVAARDRERAGTIPVG